MPDIFSWELSPLFLLAALAFGYLLGSIPFGLIFAKMAGLGDVRNIGSGNIGATNVLRTGNKKIAAATLLADLFKGTIAVLIAGRYGQEAAIVAGLGAFLGHCFPIWLKFKGGKGVATYLGVLIGLAWQSALVFGAIWLSIFALTRYSSLAALLASIAVPISIYFMGYPQIALLFVLLSVLVWVFHRENISRLMKGSENKFGKKG